MKSKAEMISAAIAPECNSISEKLKTLDRYFILYTHTFEQKDEEKKNILVFPNDERWDDAELYGLIIDMLLDYSMNKGYRLCDDIRFKGFAKTIEKLANGELK